MKPTLYLETSIIGYLTSRFSRDLITAGRQQLTRDWWDTERDRYDIFISPFVMDESEAGDAEAASERAEVLKDLPLIGPEEQAAAMAERLMREVPLPEKAAVDAAAHRRGRCWPNGLPADLELQAYCQCGTARSDRRCLPFKRVCAARDLYT